MKKLLISMGVVLIGLFSLSPLSAFAAEQSVPAPENEIALRSIPEGAKDITAIKFDKGILSPDVYVSTRLIKLVVWGGAGAASVLIAAIPGLGVQMAQAAVEAIKGYSGTIDNGIIIHFNNGFVEYVSAQ